MLILADADGLRVDLDQLRKGILQTAGDGRGASLTHVKVRELLGRQLAGGIYGGARLVGDHIGNMLFGNFLQHVHDNLFGFAGCGPVSDRDQRDIVLVDHPLHRILGGADLCFRGRLGGIDDRGVQHLSGLVDDRQLAAGTESRVPAQYNLPRNGRLHQKLRQVLSKYANGAVLGHLGQTAADLPLDGRLDQTVIAVVDHVLKYRRRLGIVRCDHLLFQVPQNVLLRGLDMDRQDLFLFAPVQSKDPVSGQLLHRLFEFVVHFVDRRYLGILCLRFHDALFLRHLADTDPVVGRIRDRLGNDVLCSVDGVLRRFHALFFRNECCGAFQKRHIGRLPKDQLRQRLQAFLLGDGGAGPSLRLVGTVKILHHHQRQGILDLLLQLRRQSALLLDAFQNCGLALLQIPEIGEALVQISQLFVIQGAGDLFPVSCDKRYGAALVDQSDGGLHLALSYSQFFCNYL